jgi:hypothetical protein
MIGLYTRLDMKPYYISKEEMVSRLRSLQKKLQRQELARMLGSQYVEASTAEREIKAIKGTLLKRKMTSFFKDFGHYIDFCIARFLFWRELRRERKKAESNATES